MIGIIILTLTSLILSIILVSADTLLTKKNIVDEIEERLPGYNCGVCGYGSCYGMAQAIINDNEAYKKCKLLKNSKPLEEFINSRLGSDKLKKGFTLIEMLGAVTLIALITSIVYPIYITSITKQKEKLYDQVIHNLKKASENYIVNENVNDEIVYIHIDSLYNLHYIEEIPKSPIDKEVMNGCIKAEYINNQYNYTYMQTCG